MRTIEVRVHTCTINITNILTTAWLLIGASAFAAPVRAAFLVDDVVLKDTTEMLRLAGCPERATARFRRAVQQYNLSALKFDFSNFPKPENGFFSFGSVSRLTEALPHKLCDTEHPYELNCFDTVVLLGTSGIKTRVGPDDLLSGLLAPHHPTNGGFMIVPVATARDAFTQCYPQWYREITESTFAESDTGQRISLTASLFRCYVLPQATKEDRLADAILAALRDGRKVTGLEFPKNAEIVLCHQVNFPQRWLVTAHAGWLVRRDKGYMYLEKSGGAGPFVRLDVETKTDLQRWFEAIFTGAERLGYSHHSVTFNDKTIHLLNPPTERKIR